jgi:hypothetical protein
LNRILARAIGEVLRQLSNASAAAVIAGSTSASSELANVPIRSPVLAGLRFSIVSPDVAGRHVPAM